MDEKSDKIYSKVFVNIFPARILPNIQCAWLHIKMHPGLCAIGAEKAEFLGEKPLLVRL